MPGEQDTTGADVARAVEALRRLSPSAQVCAVLSAVKGTVQTRALSAGLRVVWRPPIDKAPPDPGSVRAPRVRTARRTEAPDLDAVADELGLPRGRGG